MIGSDVQSRAMSRREFVVLIAMTMASVALAIDLMLPAFAELRLAFGLPEDSTSVAQTISAFFLGMAVSQAFYGPLADRFGRKRVLYAGLGIYVFGALIVAFAPSMGWLLAGRAIWGVGAAGSRVIAQAVVRDRFEGDDMAAALSYIMAIFILVPVFAPPLGAALLTFAPWQITVWFPIGFAGLLAVWHLRLAETLSPDDRIPLNLGRIRTSLRTMASNRLTVGTTIGQTLLFGAFASYLASSELIIGQIYDRPGDFPFVFGAVAAFMGLGSIANTRLVRRLGAATTLRGAVAMFVGLSTVLLVMTLAGEGRPSFWPMLAVLTVTLSSYSLIIPNANSLGLLPMGAIAGTASAVIGTLSLGGAAVIGAIIDRQFAGTITPLAVGFVITGVTGAAAMFWAIGGMVAGAEGQEPG